MIYEDNSKNKIEYLGEKFSKDLLSYKVIIIGRYGVGKTTIIHKLMDKDCDGEYAPTKTIDVKNIQFKVNDTIIQLNIWDCCGNDKYALNTPNLFKNASIAILVYAINDKEKSFMELKNWYNMLKENSEGSMIFLIGNKNDLDKEREVKIEEAEIYKDNYEDIKIFFETSALNGNNIDKLLENIAISIYEKNENDKNDVDISTRKTIALDKEDFKKKGKKKKKRCC